jgi:hypothetical protein
VNPDRFHAFVVRDAVELVLDLDEVGLVPHHAVDRLVRGRMLVQQLLRARVLPHRDAHRLVEALDRELLPRLTT